jgi:hypothetical protein
MAVEAWLAPDRPLSVRPGCDMMQHAILVFLQSRGNARLSLRHLDRLRDLPGLAGHEFYFPEGAVLPRTCSSDTHVGQVTLKHRELDVIEGSLRMLRGWEREGMFETPLSS